MGSAIKSAKGILGLGSGTISAGSFAASDATKRATKEQQIALARSRQLAESQAANRQQALTQMGLAATGRGPSLAEAQLKSAQDRNLSQMLATAQAQRGTNPALAQRALMQAQSGAGRELAQQSAEARLAERDRFLQQAGGVEGELQAGISGLGGFGVARDQAKMAQSQASAAMAEAARGRQMAFAGQIISGGAQVAAGGAKPQAAGGLIQGPGTSTSDSIPARLSDGEFVIKAEVVKQPGVLELLEKLNSGKIQSRAHGGKMGYAEGGKVESNFLVALEKAAKEAGDKIKKSVGAGKVTQRSDVDKQKFLNISGYKDGGYVDVCAVLASQAPKRKK